jgi:hypothetical protein
MRYLRYPMQFLDTTIIIRLLIGDDPKKQAACQTLFEQIDHGAMSVFVPDVVIAECVMPPVDSSVGLGRSGLCDLPVPDLLVPVVRLPACSRHDSRFQIPRAHGT